MLLTRNKTSISQDEGFYCSKHQVTVSKDIYIKIEQISNMIMTIQDVESISTNLWPMLTGKVKLEEEDLGKLERLRYRKHYNDDDHPPMGT